MAHDVASVKVWAVRGPRTGTGTPRGPWRCKAYLRDEAPGWPGPSGSHSCGGATQLVWGEEVATALAQGWKEAGNTYSKVSLSPQIPAAPIGQTQLKGS